MESSVQSGSKCGSDFSIERILGSDSRSSRDPVGVPEWLCCTRYRPPRLPRAVSSGCRSRRSGRHARVPFTAAQAAALEAAYARAPYLAPPALRALASALQLRDDRIKIWFQNRRARERREKCATISPPLAVTLPPTTGTQISFVPSWTAIQTADSNQHNTSLNREQLEHLHYGDRLLHERDSNISFDERSSMSSSTDEDRPGTPLDIESLED